MAGYKKIIIGIFFLSGISQNLQKPCIKPPISLKVIQLEQKKLPQRLQIPPFSTSTPLLFLQRVHSIF